MRGLTQKYLDEEKKRPIDQVDANSNKIEGPSDEMVPSK